jgi:hypothetical protein
MKKKKVNIAALLVAIIATIALGCGGGGGGAGGGATGQFGNPTPQSGWYLEFLVNGSKVDPLNITPGTTAQVAFVVYDVVGTRTVLPASNFTLTGATSGATLTPDGILTVTAPTNGSMIVSAQAVVGGTTRTATQEAAATSATGNGVLSGRLISTNGVTGLVYSQIEVYDQQGIRVGAALTGEGGNFRMALPASGRFLTVKPTSMPSGYLRALKYQGKNFLVAGVTCPIRIPSVFASQTTSLPAPILVPRESDGPPPPPDGCQ